MSSLENELLTWEREKPVRVTRVIAGLGGVGKTQIAIELGYRLLQKFSLIWWIPSETKDQILTALRDLCENLSKGDIDLKEEKEIENCFRAFLENFEEEKWLLIFDNVEDHNYINSILPSKGGSVLITSRVHPSTSSSIIDIHKMKREESIQLLLRLTEEGEESKEDANKLADLLGDLPLALTQAGSYLKQNSNISIPQYIEFFSKERQELWKFEEKHSKLDVCTVATTWKVTMKKIYANKPTAMAILLSLAFVYPENIPYFFVEGLIREYTNASGINLNNHVGLTISLLKIFSMVQVDKAHKTISIHRLVQLVSRDMLGKKKTLEILKRIVKVLKAEADQFEFGKTGTWKKMGELTQHVLALIEFASSETELQEDFAKVLWKVGNFLCFVEGDLQKAEDTLKHCLFIQRRFYHTDYNFEVARTFYLFGQVYGYRARFNESRSYFVKSYQLASESRAKPQLNSNSNSNSHYQSMYDSSAQTSSFNSSSNLNSTSNSNLPSNLHSNLNHNSNSISNSNLNLNSKPNPMQVLIPQSHQQGISDQEKEIWLFVADCHHEIGRTYLEQGDHSKAMEYFHFAHDLYPKILNSHQNEKVAACLHEMGRTLLGEGKAAEARLYFEQVLEIDRSIFQTDEHPLVLGALYCIARTHSLEGKSQIARSYLTDILEKNKKIYQMENHRFIASNILEIGKTYLDEGKFTEARECFERVLKIDHEIYRKDDHPFVASCWSTIGRALFGEDKIEEALEAFQKSLDIQKRVYTDNNVAMAFNFGFLGELYFKQGDLTKAFQYLSQAVQICEKAVPQHPWTQRFKASLNVCPNHSKPN